MKKCGSVTILKPQESLEHPRMKREATTYIKKLIFVLKDVYISLFLFASSFYLITNFEFQRTILSSINSNFVSYSADFLTTCSGLTKLLRSKHPIVQYKAFFYTAFYSFFLEHKNFPKPKSDNVHCWFIQTERTVLLLSVKHK